MHVVLFMEKIGKRMGSRAGCFGGDLGRSAGRLPARGAIRATIAHASPAGCRLEAPSVLPSPMPQKPPAPSEPADYHRWKSPGRSDER
jgi:hypothetical protein